jgi:hypothetical protein
MKTERNEPQPLDPKTIWDEVKRAAARAPEWASTDPPYAVKESFAGALDTSVQRAETLCIAAPDIAVASEGSRGSASNQPLRQRIARLFFRSVKV